MSLPRIGVLGGMGPAATILLQQRLLDMTDVQTDSEHLPLLIDMNTQVPSRINYLIHGFGENPGPVLARMAKGLESGGVDVIVMPCCTAHHFADDIVRSIKIPFLDMVQLVAAEIADMVPPGSDVGILASPATKNIELFKKGLQPHSLNACYPEDMRAVLTAIEALKKSGPSRMAIGLVQSAIRQLEDTHVGTFILGCTEFSLIARDLDSTVPIVDAVDVLTQSITNWDITKS